MIAITERKDSMGFEENMYPHEESKSITHNWNFCDVYSAIRMQFRGVQLTVQLVGISLWGYTLFKKWKKNGH